MLLFLGDRPAKGGLTLERFALRLDGITAAEAQNMTPFLRQLGENAGVLAPFLRAVADGDTTLQDKANDYGRDALIVARGPTWVIRLGAWRPEIPDEALLHTHTFALLTYGLAGPGYTTEIYDVDRDELQAAKIGDRVTLAGGRRVTLDEGRVLWYPPHTIAHRQLPPASYSLSLNLIVHAGGSQHFVDPANHRLVEIR